jgi:cell division protein FtsI (penicillin-binding protein 3)
MQVLDMMNTVATGGEFVPPRLVQAVVEPDGSVRELKLAPEHRELPTFVTSKLTGMLEQVVSDGTAPAAAIPGYTVAGKTGTAQIPNPKHPGYLSNAYMATFTGFAPAQDPSLSAIVVLNRPTPIFGGTVAAPVFSQVMAYALERYGIATSPAKSQGTSSTSVETYAYQSGTTANGADQTRGTTAGTDGSPGSGTGGGDSGTASSRETNSTIAQSAGHSARGP